MKQYEGVFAFPPESAPEARKAQLKSLDDIFAKFQAEILQKTEWGKRAFGYPVHKFTEGHFLVVDFKLDPLKAGEFRKSVQLQEDVIKYMITVKNLNPDKKPKALKASRVQTAPAAGV